MILLFRAPVTLTFDLMNPKSIGVICRSLPTSLSTFMILGPSVLQLSSGNGFIVSGPCDLWPYEPKINRGLLPVMTNLPINFHDPRPKRSPVIIRKPLGLRTNIPSYRPTDRPTWCKRIYPSSSKGGIKIRAPDKVIGVFGYLLPTF